MAHTLDLVLSCGIYIKNIEYRSPLGLSDQNVLSLSCQLYVHNVCTSNKFRLDKGDYSTLQKFLDKSWDTGNILDPSHSSVDTMWERFKFIMVDGINGYIPKGRPSRTGTHKNFQPFTAHLRAQIREKYQLWNRWMNSREDEIFKKYTAVRNKVKSK